jgi:4'-phosphopantetheinyl transferase
MGAVQPNEWRNPQSHTDLHPDEVQIWRARLDGMGGDDDRLWRLLSEEERHRANRFHFDQHRYRFLRSHGILRGVLAGYLGCAPQDLEFTSDQLGKPYLSYPPGIPIKFNLSHSGDLMVVGVALGRAIGVDVEVLSPNLEWYQIAKPYFHPNELEFIERTAGVEDRLSHFYRIWTMKEAYLKARGKGISADLELVEVDNQNLAAPAFVSLPEGEDKKHRWQVFSFKPATGACGTVVVETIPGPVTRFSLWNGPKPGDLPD